MDLDQLEAKMKTLTRQNLTAMNPSQATTTTPSTTTSITRNAKIASVTRKINKITDADVEDYREKVIPSWTDLQSIYESRWLKEKEKFQTHLKANFSALVERFASGKQEIFVLAAPERKEKLYLNAFLELFESGYAPHIGDIERIANKRVRKLYITLPHNYSSTC